MEFCHKLWFSKTYIFLAQCLKLLIFPALNSITSINLNLTLEMFKSSGCKDIDFTFVARKSWNSKYEIYFTFGHSKTTFSTQINNIILPLEPCFRT